MTETLDMGGRFAGKLFPTSWWTKEVQNGLVYESSYECFILVTIDPILIAQHIVVACEAFDVELGTSEVCTTTFLSLPQFLRF